ncbi:MAG: hypothetical protein NC223_02805 [Butyrivibrio sp.]|nr:hypothetical protein [Butyrivibrio sp.]
MDKSGNRREETAYVNDVTLTAQVLFKPSSGGGSPKLRTNHKVVIGGKTTEKSLSLKEPELDGGPDLF